MSIGCLTAKRPQNFILWSPVGLLINMGVAHWIARDSGKIFKETVNVANNYSSPEIVFFGSEFSHAYFAMIILLVGQTIASLAGFNGMLLTMTNNAEKVTSTLAFIVPLNLGVSAIMIKFYGYLGAAISLSSSWILIQTILSIKAFSVTGIDSTFLSLRKKIL